MYAVARSPSYIVSIHQLASFKVTLEKDEPCAQPGEMVTYRHIDQRAVMRRVGGIQSVVEAITPADKIGRLHDTALSQSNWAFADKIHWIEISGPKKAVYAAICTAQERECGHCKAGIKQAPSATLRFIDQNGELQYLRVPPRPEFIKAVSGCLEHQKGKFKAFGFYYNDFRPQQFSGRPLLHVKPPTMNVIRRRDYFAYVPEDKVDTRCRDFSLDHLQRLNDELHRGEPYMWRTFSPAVMASDQFVPTELAV